MTSDGRSYYEVLGVSATASVDDIKRAYRKLSLRWHPDKNPKNAVEATRRFNDISAAYQLLSNPSYRALYNRSMLSLSPAAAVANGGVPTDPPSCFNLRDPRVVFHEFFGGKDPFSDVFGIPDELPMQTTPTGTDDRPASAAAETICRRFSLADNWQLPSTLCASSSLTTTSTTVKAITTSTRFVHGRKIVTKKVVENGVETITVEEDGLLVSKTVDGVTVPLSDPVNANGHAQNGGSEADVDQAVVVGSLVGAADQNGVQ